jgi:hypothetical protein
MPEWYDYMQIYKLRSSRYAGWIQDLELANIGRVADSWVAACYTAVNPIAYNWGLCTPRGTHRYRPLSVGLVGRTRCCAHSVADTHERSQPASWPGMSVL